LFDRQIIIITHNRHLIEIADRWYRVELKEGISYLADGSEIIADH
jgi:DNA repair exonuclease SbcCD ATPase subunit